MALSGIRSIQVAGFLSCFACFACFGNTVAYGQSSGSQPNLAVIPRASSATDGFPASTFRLDVKLIQVPVQVTDQRDRPVMNLPKSAFRMFEDDVEQQIATFSTADAPMSAMNLPKSAFRMFEDDVEQQIATFSTADAPISAGLVFDASRSMLDRIGESRAAVDQFCETSLPADEFFLVKFSDNAELISPFTRDPGEIRRQLSAVHPHGWTAMIDAIWRSVEEMRRASNSRKVLLVLSDGGDNNSRYSESELLALVREADVRIYDSE